MFQKFFKAKDSQIKVLPSEESDYRIFLLQIAEKIYQSPEICKVLYREPVVLFLFKFQINPTNRYPEV